jgi:hypothetical protein
MGPWRLSIVATLLPTFVIYAQLGIKPNQTKSNQIKPNQGESSRIKPEKNALKLRKRKLDRPEAGIAGPISTRIPKSAGIRGTPRALQSVS